MPFRKHKVRQEPQFGLENLVIRLRNERCIGRPEVLFGMNDFTKVGALFMTAINGTQNALSPEAVDRAVALLRQAKQVYCMGQGGSMVVAGRAG